MTELPDRPTAAPKWKPLDARQRRVLGVLIEKAKTTPAAYPMSVNAIVTGCNQKNNRDPLTTLDDFGVEKALDELRNLGAVSEVDWLGRVSKYKHHAYEWLGVTRPELAVLAELLLRGAQQLGELRGRAARMEPIADLAALKPIVTALVERGLMLELTPAGRGQIVSHNLYLPEELAGVKTGLAGRSHAESSPAVHEIAGGHSAPAAPHAGPPASAPRRTSEGSESGPNPLDVARLSAEIVALQSEVARLRDRVSELEAK